MTDIKCRYDMSSFHNAISWLEHFTMDSRFHGLSEASFELERVTSHEPLSEVPLKPLLDHHKLQIDVLLRCFMWGWIDEETAFERANKIRNCLSIIEFVIEGEDKLIADNLGYYPDITAPKTII